MQVQKCPRHSVVYFACFIERRTNFSTINWYGFPTILSSKCWIFFGCKSFFIFKFNENADNIYDNSLNFSLSKVREFYTKMVFLYKKTL